MVESRLDGIPLFDRLSRRQRGKLARAMREVEIAKGEHLVDEGEPPESFFVICEGTAAVISSGTNLTELGPGDFLGEIGLLSHGHRTASVIALSPIRALVMPAETFRTMTRSMPDAAKQIEAAMEERLERDRLFGIEHDS
jgi:CRP-like cAMP-binding protein